MKIVMLEYKLFSRPKEKWFVVYYLERVRSLDGTRVKGRVRRGGGREEGGCGMFVNVFFFFGLCFDQTHYDPT